MSANDPLAWIDGALADLRRQALSRRVRSRVGPQAVRTVLDDQGVVNFGSNDYLGLAADPRLADTVRNAIAQEGWGSGASPLITGHGALHRQLELHLADFEDAESALVFSSGFAANAGTIAALVGPGDTVYSDRNNHASLWDGCRLSRADVRAYPHGDWQRLAQLLAQGAGGRRLIVTDSLFSMDGDFAPLPELAELAQRHEAMLLVDEAHATGVYGANGRGLAEHFGVEDRVHIRIGTLSKALGSVGGFVAGSQSLIQWLIHRARPYVFSTAPPAATAAAAIAALDIVRSEPQRRESLLQRSAELRQALSQRGWNLGRSTSQIIPIVVGSPERATALSAMLWQRGLFVPAIRPPTVPEGESCLRISLSYNHTPEMIASLLAALDTAGGG